MMLQSCVGLNPTFIMGLRELCFQDLPGVKREAEFTDGSDLLHNTAD